MEIVPNHSCGVVLGDVQSPTCEIANPVLDILQGGVYLFSSAVCGANAQT